METLGHVLVMLGVLTRIYTSLFSGGRKNKVLLMDGPYSIVRNPLYVGSFLAVLGIGMQTASLTIALLAALVFLAIHHFTILREEKFLSGLYGNEYQSYLEAVPRWIPQFRLWHQPQEIIVQPRMVLLTIRDASMFILALILVELLCELRTANGLPTWLNLI